jgi:spermidine synthase
MTGPTLRQRADGALELRVNGVFVMDDRETSSERLLARAVVGLGAREVLVGGLGLGYTLRELLAVPAVERVVVAELHPEIVGWMADGTIPGADLLADARSEVVVADVRATVAAQAPGSLDAIVLDVDNGPDFLVHDANAAVYESSFVQVCAERLRPDGHLCIWSMAASADVTAALGTMFEEVGETAVPVDLQGRDEHYWLLTGSRPRR